MNTRFTAVNMSRNAIESSLMNQWIKRHDAIKIGKINGKDSLDVSISMSKLPITEYATITFYVDYQDFEEYVDLVLRGYSV